MLKKAQNVLKMANPISVLSLRKKQFRFDLQFLGKTA